MGKRLLSALLVFLMLGVQAFAQNSVTGKVTDSKGEAIPGASIMVKGTNTGVITDLDGNFRIKVGANAELVFSSIGYKTTTVPVGNRGVINVILEDDTLLLDDVVVVGYGTARRKDLTGSLSAIQSETIAAQNTSTVSRMLEGAAPGLRVAATDGQPGFDMGIRIRGISSTKSDAASALIVIDGVAAQPAAANQNALENPLSRLNPEDIASVTILKDAASTALYGSRGANGVVLITTKAGQAGKAQISFESRVGYNFVGPYNSAEIDKASDYYEFAWRSIYNSYRYGVGGTGLPGVGADDVPYTNFNNPNHSDAEARQFASAHLFDYVGSETSFEENGLGNWMAYSVPGAVYTTTGEGSKASSTMSGAFLVGTDGKINPNAKLLYDESYANILMKKAFRQDYNVSARGGNDKMHYYLSLGYLDEPSFLVASSFKRYSGRANVDAMITNWLKVGANVSYANTNTRTMATRWQNRGAGGASGNTMYYVKMYPPIISVYEYDANGNVKLDDNGNKVVAKGPTYSPLGDGKNVGTNFNRDLLWETETNQSTFNNQTWTPKVFAEVTLPYGFKFTGNFTMEEYTTRNLRYMNHEAGRGASRGGMMLRKMSRTVMNTQQLLTWNREYGKHHFDALVGHEYEDLHSEIVQYASADELLSGYVMPGNFTSRFNNISGYENDKWQLDDFRLESYLGRLNYIYDEKYYLSGSFRRDGSSKFIKENRWGNFWSVGAGWRISSEPWMEGTKTWLDNAKIRASYGVTGNQNGVSEYYINPTWSYGVSRWKAVSNGTGQAEVFSLTSPGLVDTDITWEHVHQFDTGLDFTLFNSRISGAIDYYNNLTTNSLYSQAVSPLANMANTTHTRNCAKLRNTGIEFELSSDIIRNKDFNWNLSLNLTHFRTTLVDVPDSQLPFWDPKTSELPEGTWTAASETWAATGGQNAGQGKLYLRGEGRDIYNLYLYKYAGVDEKSGLPMYWHHVTYADVNADSKGNYAHGGRYTSYKEGDDVKTLVSADASQYEYGSATPDIMGGLTSSFRWKNWDLSTVWAFQLGGKFFSREFGEMMYRTSSLAADWNKGDSWVAKETVGATFNESNTGAYFPMQWWANGRTCRYDGDTIGSWQFTNMALFNASYLRLKNVTLGYTLPKKLTEKVHIGGLRAYVSADNLVFFSAHKGIDPSLSAVGGYDVAQCVYPQMANVIFGIKLDF